MKKIFLWIIILFIIFSCEKTVNIETQTIEQNQQEASNLFDAQNNNEQPLISISKNDQLIVTVRYDYEPFMWVKNNEFKGFYVDVEKAVLEKMGQNYSFIKFTDAEAAGAEIKDGTIHAAVGAPIIPDYQQILNFSNSYYTLGLTTLVRINNKDIGGNTKEEVIQSLFDKTVGVQARGAEYNMLREYRDIKIVEYETGTVALEKLAAGEVDAKIENKEIALYHAKKNGWDIKAVGVPLDSLIIATGFSKRVDPEIIDRYNAALNLIMDDGTYDKIYSSWFGE